MKKLIIFVILAVMTTSGLLYAANEKMPASAPGFSQRTLREGDTLNITVWQHKDLSTAVTIDENGNIEYLFLGIISAAGKTLNEVKDILRKGISENYIVDPKIDISVDRKSLTFF